MSVKLEAGQWYRTRNAGIVYCVGRKPDQARHSYPWVVCDANGSSMSYLDDGFYSIETKEHGRDIIDHLPDCTGFDWDPPKPVVAPEGWEIVKYGVCTSKDKILLASGDVTMIVPKGTIDGETIQYALQQLRCTKAVAIIRKIEPKYRPFTWDEREQLRDRIVVVTDGESVNEARVTQFVKYGNEFYIEGYDPKLLLANGKFSDGSPVGVLVDD